MKKIITGLTFALAAGMSGSAMAAVTFGETVSELSVSGTSTGDCPLLASTVKLGISANAIGGYACDEGNNIIQVAACHTGGSRDEVSCASYDASTNAIEGCSSTAGVGTPDFKAFFATSEGGMMSEKGLGTRCTENSLGALSDWVN